MGTSGKMSHNISLNMSVDELLLKNFGPRRHDLPVVIILMLIYCLIFISGILGNICTCFVIVKNSYMQTTTNYYLFSLAISDVLTLIFGEYVMINDILTIQKLLKPSYVYVRTCLFFKTFCIMMG